MIHTNIWASEQFATLTRTGRLLFIGIITHADDEGRFKASAALLRAEIFPYDDIPSGEMETEIKAIAAAGLIVLYEIEGQRYGYLPTWETYQTLRKDRIRPSSIPAPSGQPADNQPATSGQPDGGVSKDKRSKGKVSKDIVGADGAYPEAFEKLWSLYPRKTGKGDALKAWAKLKASDALNGKIAASIEAYSKTRQWQKDDGQFIPHFSTFLNQRRFDDEPGAGSTPAGKYGKVGRTIGS